MQKIKIQYKHFHVVKNLFTGIKADEEADDKQPDTTDIFNLDSEKSDEQKRKRKFIKKH